MVAGVVARGGLPLVVAGSVLPDVLDYTLRLRHRSPITHNVLTVLLLLCLLPLSPLILFVALGVAHHLLLDALTKRGVYVGKRTVSLHHFTSSDPFANMFITLLHLAILPLFL